MHIKTGDTVIVIAGKDKVRIDKKGEKKQVTGKVLKVYQADGKVLVEGVNMVKKTQKPKQASQKGGIVEQEAPIEASNVMIQDPKTGEPTRIGYKIVGEGDAAKKVRYTKKSGTILDK